MLDARLRPWIDPPLNAIGRRLAAWGLSANQVTLAGMSLGILAALAVGLGHYHWGLGLIIASRLLDGLDGAVARATQMTDFGGYLDIVCDFVFYLAIPLGFGVASPDNLLAALVLEAVFALTGVSFLAYATLAAKHNLQTQAHGKKSFFYSTGLAEGTETLVAFIVMALFPAAFSTIAMVYAGLCMLTVLQRSVQAYRVFFIDAPPPSP